MLENRVYQFTDIGLYTYLYLNYNIEQWHYGRYERTCNIIKRCKRILHVIVLYVDDFNHYK